jgi:hypothetical protein
MSLTEAAVLLDDGSLRGKIDSMNLQQVELRRNEILALAKGDFENLSVDNLRELAYIASKLRRTNVGPPKEPKKAAKPKSVMDLL